MMTKLEALAMLSDVENLQGAQREAADKIGITYQAVAQWPETLTPALEDRVLAAWFRQSQRKALDQLLVGAQARRAAIEAASPATVPNAAITGQAPAQLAKKARGRPRKHPAATPATTTTSSPEIPVGTVDNPFRA